MPNQGNQQSLNIHSHQKLKNMNEQLKIGLLLVGFAITTGFIGYMIRDLEQYDDTLPHIIDTVRVDHYSLEPGTDGILEFSVDKDSLAYVVFVQQQDTFAMDALMRSEFDSLVNVLYKDTMP